MINNEPVTPSYSLDETPNKKKKWRNEEPKDGAKKPLFSEAERPSARYSDLGGIEAILEV